MFVDDLDRCQPAYVVELLEGIQTIFGDIRITFLVAADREWIGESFQRQYGDFADVMGRPGRPMGYLFLEKVFAVSAPLPRPSLAALQRYRAAVLAGRSRMDERITPAARDEAWHQLESVSVDEAVVKAAATKDDNSVTARAVREAAAAKVADAIQEGEEDPLLQPYLDLVEENPRALKRLRNAYAIATVGRVTAGETATDDDRDGLVRWTILALRWPRLAAYLLEHPKDLACFLPGSREAANGDVPGELAALRGDSALTRLLTEPAGETPSSLASWVVGEFLPRAPTESEGAAGAHSEPRK